MRPNIITGILVIIAISSVFCLAADQSHFYVLREQGNNFLLEKMDIDAGQTLAFSQEEYVTVILPVSQGQSGDLIQRSIDQRMFAVTFDGENFQVTVVLPTGTQRMLPRVRLTDLETWDVRVNITSYTGTKRVYMIRKWDDCREGSGPVIDMFQGRVPLQKGDYSITTETTVHVDRPSVYGEAPLEFEGGLLVTSGRIAGGKTADFIVDLGASGSIIVQDYLPAGTEIEEVKALQYSDKGEEVLDGVMGGAGGTVTDFKGNAVIDELTFGSMTFSDVTLHVVDQDMDYGGHKVAGIIGLDLLRRAEVVSLGYGAGSRLRLSEDGSARGGKTVPFTMAVDHIFMAGRIGRADVTFLLDTGAWASIISTELAERAGLRLTEGEGHQFRGMDGNMIPSKLTEPVKLIIGEHTFDEMGIYAADLNVMQEFGLAGDGVLLGNDFLPRFQRIEVDFGKKTIRFF